MSNAVLPTFAGLKWDRVTSPEFHTKTQRSVNGRELRAAFMAYPLWTFKQAFEVLRDSGSYVELQTLMGFFNTRLGSFDSFLYTCPDDNTVTDQSIGTGSGSATQFQLVRPLGAGGFSLVEPVQNTNSVTNVKVNSVTQNTPADYNVGSTGIVTFANAPAANLSVTWSGTFYYRVRFVNDKLDFKKMMQGLWSADTFEFVGAPGNKV